MEIGIYQAFFGNPAQIGHFDLAAKHFPSPEACIVNDEVKNELGENTIELQRLYIDTACHGKQIGKHLMEKALIYARENRYDWIWLGVWERNFNAQHFYAKWGFEKFGEHVFQMGDDPQIDWLLKKKL